MSFKEDFNKNLDNKKAIQSYRYRSAKMMFITMSYIFFVVFFFIASGYYEELLGQFLVPSYIAMLVSFPLYSYFYGKTHYSSSTILYTIFVFSLLAAIASFVILFV